MFICGNVAGRVWAGKVCWRSMGPAVAVVVVAVGSRLVQCLWGGPFLPSTTNSSSGEASGGRQGQSSTTSSRWRAVGGGRSHACPASPPDARFGNPSGFVQKTERVLALATTPSLPYEVCLPSGHSEARPDDGHCRSAARAPCIMPCACSEPGTHGLMPMLLNSTNKKTLVTG